MNTRIKKLISVFLIGIIAVTSCLPVFAAEHYTSFTEAEVLERIENFKASHPEGSFSDNCATFASELVAAIFGDLPGRRVKDFDDIRIGDSVRMNNGTHSAVVIGITDTEVVIAEGNYNDTVRWGYTYSKDTLKSVVNVISTHYPEEGILTTSNINILSVNYFSPGKSYNILYTDPANAVPGNPTGLSSTGVNGKNVYTSLDELKSALAPYGLTITGEKSDAKVALLNGTVPAPTPAPVTPTPVAPTTPTPAASNQVNVTVNGVPVVFKDQGPIIVNGRTMLPVAAISEAIGVTINWNAETGTVEITE